MEHEQKVISTAVMHCYRETYCQIVFCVYDFDHVVVTREYFFLFIAKLYRVLVVHICTVA